MRISFRAGGIPGALASSGGPGLETTLLVLVFSILVSISALLTSQDAVQLPLSCKPELLKAL